MADEQQPPPATDVQDQPTVSPCFNKTRCPDADVCLQSSDDVLFKRHRRNLSFHSPIFDNMFKFAVADNKPITLTESARTLEIILLCIYPSTRLEEYAATDASLLEAQLASKTMDKYELWAFGPSLISAVQ